MNYAFKGYESGAVDFLHKPLDTLAVKSKVSVFVDLYRQRKVLDRQLQALERSRQEQELLLSQLQVARVSWSMPCACVMTSCRSSPTRCAPAQWADPGNPVAQDAPGAGQPGAFSGDKLQAMVERDERQINSLIRLIEDMLDVSRIRTGKLSLRPKFDLGQLVGWWRTSPPRPRRWTHIELQRCEPLQGEWDEFRIEQVVANLLSNALRYGERKPVQVRCSSRTAWRVQVQDQGIGIMQPTSSAFSSSSSGSPPSRPAAGWAWGCISEQIVQAHGGRYRSKVKRARVPPSPCNCRWRNRTTKRPGAGNLCVSLGLMATVSISRR
jgi:hypothetical protein